MKITSIGLKNGIFDDKYGKRGQEISIPFKIEDIPKNTKSFAFLFEDKDAIPVCGFSFIHWVGWNLTRDEVQEGESETANDFISGYYSLSKEINGFPNQSENLFCSIQPRNYILPEAVSSHLQNFSISDRLDAGTSWQV